MENVRQILGDRITYCDSEYEALEGADALAVVTEWTLFRKPDFEQVKKLMKAPVIFDGRNIYNVDEITQAGFHYESIGR